MGYVYRFEDFQKNKVETFKNIGKFLDIEMTQERIDKLIDITDINKMKQKVDMSDTVKLIDKKVEFIGKGIVGKKTDGLDDELVEKIKAQEMTVDGVFKKSKKVRL